MPSTLPVISYVDELPPETIGTSIPDCSNQSPGLNQQLHCLKCLLLAAPLDRRSSPNVLRILAVHRIASVHDRRLSVPSLKLTAPGATPHRCMPISTSTKTGMMYHSPRPARFSCPMPSIESTAQRTVADRFKFGQSSRFSFADNLIGDQDVIDPASTSCSASDSFAQVIPHALPAAN